MKHILITIAAVVLVGCGESQQSAPAPEAKPEPPTVKAPDISIHDAAGDGNIEAVKQHLAAGTDVNAKSDGDSATPLQYAAMDGHKEVVELLIAKGADVNAGLSYGTPLHNATTKQIAELLITNGADVNAKSEGGTFPLHFAATKGIAKLLIDKGADVNVRDNNGSTPLHFSARVGEWGIAELLIAKGADVNAKDKWGGDTPLDYASTADSPNTIDLLRKHGGKTGEELKAAGK